MSFQSIENHDVQMRPLRWAHFLCLAAVLFVLPSPATAQSWRSAGGGEYELPHSECLSGDKRRLVHDQVLQAAHRFRGQKHEALQRPSAIRFTPPVRKASHVKYFDLWAISNFVDNDPRYPNLIRDYSGSNRSYDLASGYNHQGTDYFIWPFPWFNLDNDALEVVAAAPGTIVLKSDGNGDRNCDFTVDSDWNAVYLLHDDGTVTWYGHLKKGSLTAKEIGERVERGEFLGIVASSGRSSGPHLHFEVYDSQGKLIDPYVGAGNPTTKESWWESQEPYRNTTINHLALFSRPYTQLPCPQREQFTELSAVRPGSTVFFTSFLRDYRALTPATYTVYSSEGSVLLTWNHSASQPAYNASFWWFEQQIPEDAPTGVYRFSCTLANQTREIQFLVGTPLPLSWRPVLQAPRNNLDSLSSIEVQCVWNPVPDALTYNVQIAENPGFQNLVKSFLQVSNPSVAFRGLKDGTRYYWRVAASNGVSTSEWSDVWSFRTGDRPLGSSELLHPPADTTIGADSALFLWSSARRANSYTLQISLDSLFTTPLTFQRNDTSAFIFRPLERDTVYYWRVKPQRDANEGEWTPWRSFRVMPNVPDFILLEQPLDAARNTDTAITFKWEPLGKVTYDFLLALGSMSGDTVAYQTRLDVDTTRVEGLAHESRYVWMVRAQNIAGAGEWSQVRSFTTTKKLINRLTEDRSQPHNQWLRIYPVPASSYLVFESQSQVGQELWWELTDLFGMYRAGGHLDVDRQETVVLPPNLSSGLYVLRYGMRGANQLSGSQPILVTPR